MPKEFIQKLTSLVEANLSNENFGPEELAREAGMSHSTLNRKLKSITNKNCSQFIREIRLEKAKELLLNEDLTAAEISYRVGFGSPTYFNKCFHEHFGYAPGELRNHDKNSEPEKQLVEPPVRGTKRTKILVGLMIVLSILIALSVFLINKISKETIQEKSIAVLPFKYLGEETQKQQYQADGMMSIILSHLSKIYDLRVISETSVEQYRNTIKTAKTIGKEQGVGYLLEGNLLRNGNKLRLNVQLIRTKNENHVWSHIYDFVEEDIFSTQSEVAEAVAGELQAAITPEEKQRIRKLPTTSITAYDYYLKGKSEYEQNFITINGDSIALKKAKYHFQKALELDSTFALAYTGLAEVYYRTKFSKTYFSENFMDSVLILANKALSYDPQCSEAYGFRATRYLDLGQPAKALKEIEMAIKYDPNDWRAYSFRGYILFEFFDYVGGIENRNEAILRNHGSRLPLVLENSGYVYIDIGFSELGKKYFQQALELDRDSLKYLTCMAYAEYCNENLEKAYRMAKSVYERDTNRTEKMALFCTISGRDDEAYYFDNKVYERAKRSGDINLYISKNIGRYLWQTGRKKEAEFLFNQQIKICEESIKLGRTNAFQKGAHFDLAGVYAFLGDKEKAYYYLDEVNKNKVFPLWWVILFKYDPLLEPIREEPRFQKILKEVEAKYQAEHERVGEWLKEQKIL